MMSKKTALDLLAQEIATLKSDKEELATNVTEMQVENSRLKTALWKLSRKHLSSLEIVNTNLSNTEFVKSI